MQEWPVKSFNELPDQEKSQEPQLTGKSKQIKKRNQEMGQELIKKQRQKTTRDDKNGLVGKRGETRQYQYIHTRG